MRILFHLRIRNSRRILPTYFYTSKIKVNTKPVDGWLDEKNVKRSNFNFLNIDIQGYELEALKGMTKHLKAKKIELIKIELSFIPRYNSVKPNFYDILIFLNKLNYKLFSTSKIKYKNNAILFMDAFFKKN